PEAVRAAIFNVLDTDKSGRLTKDKLAAAERSLLALDTDEDDILTPRELVGPVDPAAPRTEMSMPGRPGAEARGATENKTVLLLPATGEMPPLPGTLFERYGGKAAKTLTRQQLGLDAPTFTSLDANRDGVLDTAELAAFAKRPPDVELTARVGTSEARVVAT